LPKLKNIDGITDLLSNTLKEYSQMITGENRSCNFDLRLGSNSTYFTTLIQLYNSLVSLGGDVAGLYKEKIEVFFSQLKDLFMDGSWWRIDVPNNKFSVEMPDYYFGVEQDVECKGKIVSAFLVECLKTKDSNIDSSLATYLPKAYVELKTYWEDINIPDKLDSTDINKGGPKWSVLGNYAHRCSGDADEKDSFHKLGRNIRSGAELEAYLDEVKINYKKDVIAVCKPLKECPLCRNKLTILGKCQNAYCANYGKKIFNNQDINDDVVIKSIV